MMYQTFTAPSNNFLEINDDGILHLLKVSLISSVRFNKGVVTINMDGDIFRLTFNKERHAVKEYERIRSVIL